MSIELLIIDPQVDFCDPERGALYVSGAERDIQRISEFIRREGERLDRIHVTLDSHNPFHIAHPLYWSDAAGNHPNPFATITVADVAAGRWRTSDPSRAKHGLAYVSGLETEGRYQLTIWPYHCLIGSIGHTIMPPLGDVLADWEKRRLRAVSYIFKGSNPHTEHYSAVRAEMTIARDPGTQTNTDLAALIRRAQTVIVAGEAGSHCVANTVRDLIAIAESPKDGASKIVLLGDAVSPVTGFERLQESFVAELTRLGMRIGSAYQPLDPPIDLDSAGTTPHDYRITA